MLVAAQARWLRLARSDHHKETDLIALAAGLLAVLPESMQPAHASLWRRTCQYQLSAEVNADG